jgi:hypothetical protein
VDLGQALVIAMLVVAMIGALIAFTAEAKREPQPVIEAAPKPIKWVNVSSTDATSADANWLSLIHSDLQENLAVITNLATPGATADQLAQLLKSSEPVESIDVATIWVGPEDLLAGAPLAEFEESLSYILDYMSARRARIIVGNLPDLTSELVNARLALHDVVRPVIEQRNSSIARLTAAHCGILVDFHSGGDNDQRTLRFLNGTRFEPDADAQEYVATKFASAMSDALVTSA